LSTLELVGRASSLYTRMPAMFAEELRVPYQLVPIYDMTALGQENYAGNPAMKLPILRLNGSNGPVLFGAQNICRAIADRAKVRRRIVWPEMLSDELSRNAQELVWHCMAAQVQIVFGTLIGKLPTHNIYFVKARSGLEGSLRWLDANLSAALDALPPSDLSLFEVSLHCLLEHLTFRGTLVIDPYPSLLGFTRVFAKRPSAQRTLYRFDPPPGGKAPR
jgi:glutathione S-transferase